jgi:hypothetical protein
MPKRKPKAPKIPNARRLFRRAKEVITETLVYELEFWAEEIREEFIERIDAQSFASFQVVLYPESGTNLSPEWLARKAAAGADERTMIATGHYTRSIRVFKKFDRKEKKWIIRVGFHPRMQARDLKNRIVAYLLDDVALVQELGSIKANVPARPHWGPHRTVVKSEAPAKRKELVKTTMQALKRDTQLKKLATGVR